MKVLVVLGHPRNPSLCAALADAYVEGAMAAGMEVEQLSLGSLHFDPDVLTVSPCDQPLEPDLKQACRLIAWADHLTFVYPAWWGMMPARLKGFLDRVMLPGFAFREREDGRFEGLLPGKTAHLITTLDMPPWVYRFIYRAPGLGAMKRSTLGFCGIATSRVLALGPVKDSDAAQRAGWIERARRLGFSLRRGPASAAGRIATKLLAWLKALRLQFYPMSWMAYSIGALGATASTGSWNAWLYWLGYAYLFCVEAATVFTNERFDYESDRRNTHHGAFTGGSRVLVNGELSFRELHGGIAVAIAAALMCGGLILDSVEAATLPVVTVMALGLALGLGYTAPPLKLAWRGLGEVNVAFTHSFAVILAGYLLQGGAAHGSFPWLMGAPLFLAVLPAIILSGVPDEEADSQAGKETLVVRLGRGRAMLLSVLCAAAAALVGGALRNVPAVRGCFDGMLPLVLPHALLVGILIWFQSQPHQRAGRIDGLMLASLSYILWFVVIPFVQLMRA